MVKGCPGDCLCNRQTLQIGAPVRKRRKTSAIGCASYWFGTWSHFTFVKRQIIWKRPWLGMFPDETQGQSYYLCGKTHFKEPPKISRKWLKKKMKSQWFQEITQLLRKQAHKCEAEKQGLRSYKMSTTYGAIFSTKLRRTQLRNKQHLWSNKGWPELTTITWKLAKLNFNTILWIKNRN